MASRISLVEDRGEEETLKAFWKREKQVLESIAKSITVILTCAQRTISRKSLFEFKYFSVGAISPHVVDGMYFTEVLGCVECDATCNQASSDQGLNIQ